MHKGDSKNGWVQYTTNIKTDLSRELYDKECKELMGLYIRGVKWEDALKEIRK